MIAIFRKYLSDPTEDVRVATEAILADFLREIKDITFVSKRSEEQARQEAGGRQQEHPPYLAPEHEDGHQDAYYPDDGHYESEDRDLGGTIVFFSVIGSLIHPHLSMDPRTRSTH
jgi:hypothetical protein